MYHDVSHLLSRLINGPTPLRQIYFTSTNSTTPELAYQVDFPRLEIVLEGEFVDSGIDKVLTPAMSCLFGWRLEYSAVGHTGHDTQHSVRQTATGFQRRPMGRQAISKHYPPARRSAWAAYWLFSAANAP